MTKATDSDTEVKSRVSRGGPRPASAAPQAREEKHRDHMTSLMQATGADRRNQARLIIGSLGAGIFSPSW
jgi:hypothetical protein